MASRLPCLDLLEGGRSKCPSVLAFTENSETRKVATVAIALSLYGIGVERVDAACRYEWHLPCFVVSDARKERSAECSLLRGPQGFRQDAILSFRSYFHCL